MSSQTLNGRNTSKYAGFGAVFTALVAFTLLGMSAGSAQAQVVLTGSQIAEAQGFITAALATLEPGKTITNAKSADLAAAVNEALVSDTDPTLPPAAFAVAALSPVGSVAVSKTQISTATTIVSPTGIIDLLVTGTTAAKSSGTIPLGTDIADITDGVVDSGSGAVLTFSDKEAVVKEALLTISNLAVSTGSASLLAVDTSIGETLASDTTLNTTTFTASKKNLDGLVTLLESAITGIDGAKSKTISATTLAANIPAAAGDFVQGIVDGGIPDSLTLPVFAVDIMGPLAKNASADEDMAYALASGTSAAPHLTTLAEALITNSKFSKAIAKITQGITAQVSTSTGEVTRNTFIDGLVTGDAIKDATAILEGAVYTDPYYSSLFTGSVMTDIAASTNGHKVLASDAAGIASGVGAILGVDGDALSEVSGTFASFVDSGILAASNAGKYAADLINGAADSKLPSSDFTQITLNSDGGVLNVGTAPPHSKLLSGIATETVADMESIADQFTAAIIDFYATSGSSAIQNKKSATTVAGDIGTLVKDIAKVTGNETFGSTPTLVAADIAASVVDTVDGFGSDLTGITFSDGKVAADTAEAVIVAAITADVDADVSKSNQAAIAAAISAVETSSTNGSVYGFAGGNVATGTTVNEAPITAPETPITNL
jgi:hypothetical protein